MGYWRMDVGGNEEKDSIAATIHAYIDNGLLPIDTAPVYGLAIAKDGEAKPWRGFSRDKIDSY